MITLFKNIFTALQQSTFLMDLLQTILIVVGTAVCSRILKWVNTWVSCHFIKRTHTQLDDEIFKMVEQTIRRVLWLAAFYFMIQSFESVFPEGSMQQRYTLGALYIVTVFMVTHLLSNTLQILLEWYSGKWGTQSAAHLKEEFRPLIRRLIIIVVYTVAVVMILKHFHQDISSILVSLGIGSLAFALAAKDTLANMIAGFMIMTDRPFRMGDRILLESGEKGDVYDIGLRTTKILTFDNTLIIVPNQQIINEKVTNLSYPDPNIRVVVEVGVAYGSDLDQVKELLVTICRKHPDVLEYPAPEAHFLNFGDSSLDVRVVCRVDQWSKQWKASEEIRMEVYRQFGQKGIEIPFPQRVVTMSQGSFEP